MVDLLLESLQKRLRDRQLGVQVTDGAKQFIIENGYDPVYGARPLKRFIQQKVETLVARQIIAANPQPDTIFVVDTDGEKLILKQ